MVLGTLCNSSSSSSGGGSSSSSKLEVSDRRPEQHQHTLAVFSAANQTLSDESGAACALTLHTAHL
jgi:hypothetical protein